MLSLFYTKYRWRSCFVENQYTERWLKNMFLGIYYDLLCENKVYAHMEMYVLICVCMSSLQECLEKCGESLQEIVNYHTVRHTSALATGERSG